MMTPAGVLIGTLVSYVPTKFETDRPIGLGVITVAISLKDRVMHSISLSRSKCTT